MKNNEIRDIVIKASEEVIKTSVDLVLFSIYYGYELSAAGYSGRGFEANEKATDSLTTLNYQKKPVLPETKRFCQNSKKEDKRSQSSANNYKRGKKKN